MLASAIGLIAGIGSLIVYGVVLLVLSLFVGDSGKQRRGRR